MNCRRESDLRRIEKENEERMQKQKEMEEQKQAAKQSSNQTTGQPSSNNTYEIEEGFYCIEFYYFLGEDTFANMKEIMGFGSFSSTNSP